FRVFPRLVAKSTEQWIAGLAGTAEKIELRLAPGHADQTDQLQLVVLLRRPVEEFEFPVRPAGDVENTIRTVPAVHHQHGGVIGQRGFLRFVLSSRFAEFVLRASPEPIKAETDR